RLQRHIRGAATTQLCRDTLAPVLLQGRGDRRELHSFPTRRSSDLCTAKPGTPEGPAGQTGQAGHAAGLRNTYPTPRRVWINLGRSEEHTSELQSRENLVCRLLLEKKNAERGHVRDGVGLGQLERRG